MADYIPGADDRFSRWLDQFLSAATDNATALSLSPADLTGLGTRITDFQGRLTACTAADAAAKQATADKKNSRQLAEQLVRALAKRVSTQPGFTPAIGEALGITSPEAGGAPMTVLSADATVAKPVLKGKALANGAAEIKFTKGDSDGVNLYSQRDGDADYVFLARDTHSPYVDNRALLVAGKPEKRKYMARFLKNDQEYGLASDEMTVICSP
jgi:hypothetical protein